MRLKLEPLNDSDQVVIRSQAGRALGIASMDAFVEPPVGHDFSHCFDGGPICSRLTSGEMVTVEVSIAEDEPC